MSSEATEAIDDVASMEAAGDHEEEGRDATSDKPPSWQVDGNLMTMVEIMPDWSGAMHT